MQIELPLNPTATLTLADGADRAAVVTALSEFDPLVTAMTLVGESSYFTAFEADRDFDDTFARRIARAHSEGGLEAAEDHLMEAGIEQNAGEYYHNAGVKSDAKALLLKIVDEVIEAVPALSDEDPDDMVDALEDHFRDTVIEAMERSDRSGPLDAIPSHVKVEWPFVLGAGELGVDDLMIDHIDNVSQTDTVIPNSKFLHFLKLANVSVGEFLAAAKAEGHDLTDPVIGENVGDYLRGQIEANALQWKACLDVERGENSNISKLPLRGLHEINEWNARVELINGLKDESRPRALDDKKLVEVVDNATYGGVATFVARVPLKALLEGEYNEPFLAEGGFVGIHDFLNGSGHIVTPTGPVLIDPAAGAAFIGSSRKDAVDDVYGIVTRYYDFKKTAYEPGAEAAPSTPGM